LLRSVLGRTTTHLVQAAFNASDEPIRALEEFHQPISVLVQLIIVPLELRYRWNNPAHQNG
jgi:hypothetical protein